MRRTLINFVSAVSLVTCVATCVIWVRGYLVEDGAFLSLHRRYACFASFQGAIGCEFGRKYGCGYSNQLKIVCWHRPTALVPPSDYIHIVEAEGRFGHLRRYHYFLGFRWHPRMDGDWEYRERGVAVPGWFAVGLLAVLPTRKIWQWFSTARKTTRGFWASADRCPECEACRGY